MSTDALPTRDARIAAGVRRVVGLAHYVRTVGLGLGAIAVGMVLHRHGTNQAVMILLALYGFVWPHVVWQIVRRSVRPTVSDRSWVLVDAAMGGFWIALMQFNALPSVLLVVMYAMSMVAIGGAALLLRGMAMLMFACFLAAAVNGLAFAPTTRMPELLASIPLLIVLPMTLSVIMQQLAQRVRRQNRVLREISSIDSLSGLLNRGHWEDAVSKVLEGQRRNEAVLLLIDIDHFKHVNDQYGHTVGDEVIRVVGAVIHDSLREKDVAGRYGGDEFGVLLDGADAGIAELVAERIRSGVARTLVEQAPGLHCTLSIGVAPYSTKVRDTREWVKDADAALYSAKFAGRNRYVTVTEGTCSDEVPLAATIYPCSGLIDR